MFACDHVLTSYLLTDALQVGANQFLQTGTQLKRKMWWKNVKVKMNVGIGENNTLVLSSKIQVVVNLD